MSSILSSLHYKTYVPFYCWYGPEFIPASKARCGQVWTVIWEGACCLQPYEYIGEEFSSRFPDFRDKETFMQTFSFPFSSDNDGTPSNVQLEFADFQRDSVLKDKYCNIHILDFYSKYVSLSWNKKTHTVHALHIWKLIHLWAVVAVRSKHKIIIGF